jgi:hypothetical protein
MDRNESRTLNIALDYDETFTADKGMWTEVVRVMRKMGHDVTFVTFREGPTSRHSDSYNDDILGDAQELGIPVVFSNHRQKSHVFKADIWIDDMPILIPSYDDIAAMEKGCRVNSDFGGMG